MPSTQRYLSPLYYLQKYKTTQRPRPCNRCGQNAYYWHPSWDWVCASHLLDLINIGGMAFSWEEYPEVWARTERLLLREAPSSTGVKSMELEEETDVVNGLKILDGLNE
jgi:hypothetical protein